MGVEETKAGETKPRSGNGRGLIAWVQFGLLLFASAFGVYQFWYKEQVVPSRRPAALAISGELEEIGRKGHMSLIRARIHAENKKDVRIYAPALWYTVTGMRIDSIPRPATYSATDTTRTPADRYALHSDQGEARVVATWRLPGSGVGRDSPDWSAWYDPGDATTNDELFYVPSDTYDALELKVEVVVSRNIEELAPTTWRVEDDGALTPQIMIRVANQDPSAAKAELFAPDTIVRHRRLELSTGLGQNWSVTTLSLLSVAKK